MNSTSNHMNITKMMNWTAVLSNSTANISGEPKATNAVTALFTATEYQAQAAILLLIISLIIIGNTITLCIIYRDKSMRTPQYLLITSLACSDMGVGVATAPLTMFTAFNNGTWVLRDVTCQYQAIANSTFYMATMFTLMAMTMEKYFSIVRPLSRFVTVKRTRKFIVGAWLVTLAISMLPLIGFGRYDINITTQSCGIAFPEATTERLYLVLILLSGLILPLFVMIVANTLIFVAVRRHSKRLRRHARGKAAKATILASQKHFTITITIILAVFIGSWTPFFLLAVTAEVTDRAEDIPPLLGVLAYWCGYAASAWNPVIYVTRNRKFRQGAFQIKNKLLCSESDVNAGTMNGVSVIEYSDGDRKRYSFVSI